MTVRLAARALALGAGLACVMGALAASAREGSDTFEGSCDFSGRVVFDPPLSNSQRATRQRATAVGHCSGNFTTANGRNHQLDGDRVLYWAKSSGDDLSCASSTATGAGFLKYKYKGHKLRFRLSEDRVASGGTLRLTGEAGGSFEATLKPAGDLVAISKKCSGNGLHRTEIEFSGSSAPTISG